MPLSVGDTVYFDHALGEVVATTNSTNQDGYGYILHRVYDDGHWYEWTFDFRALRAELPDIPITATDDPEFRVGLLHHPDDEWLYALVLDDPHEGRLIRPHKWMGADYLDNRLTVFVTCWAPDTLLVVDGAAGQAYVPVDIELHWQTSSGTYAGWWQPAYPFPNLVWNGSTYVRGSSSQALFVTDDSGIVRAAWTEDGYVLFPRGHGAWGQRTEDRMWDGPDAPYPERVLTAAYLCYGAALPVAPPFRPQFYCGDRAVVEEGEGALLDVAGATVTVTGPPSTLVRMHWKGTSYRFQGSTDSTGTLVFTGVPGGEYHIVSKPLELNPNRITRGMLRKKVEVPAGHLTSVSLGDVSLVPDDVVQGRLYWYGAEPAAGVTVHALYTGPPADPVHKTEKTTTTASDGFWEFVQQLGPGEQLYKVWVETPYGYWEAHRPAPWSIVYWNIALGGRVALDAVPWGDAGAHINVRSMSPPAYLRRAGRDEVYCCFVRDDDHGWFYSELGLHDYSAADQQEMWEIVADDGTVLLWGIPGYYDPRLDWPRVSGDDMGSAHRVTVGGKIHGNVLRSSDRKLEETTTPLLEEAARMGLEHGTLAWGLDLRHRTEQVGPTLLSGQRISQAPGEDQQVTTRALCHLAMLCPYCGAPVWRLPNTDTYRRGYCMQCAEAWVVPDATDARTYFETITIGSFVDWHTQIALHATEGGHASVDLHSHWRPENYQETDAYLDTPSWLGPSSSPPPRWVATHFVFGTYSNSEFTDGTNIAAQEAAQQRLIGPCQLKAILPPGQRYTGPPAPFRAHCQRPDEVWEWVEFELPHGMRGAGVEGVIFPDFVRLATKPHVAADRAGAWDGLGFYVDVDAIESLEDPPRSVTFSLVNDAPHRNNPLGVPVREQAAEPFAIAAPLWGRRAPYIFCDAAGRLHRFQRWQGFIVHDVLESLKAGWGPKTIISDPEHDADIPCGAALDDGILLATYQWAGRTILRRSRDDGATWETVWGA